jgi:hypothetical protein
MRVDVSGQTFVFPHKCACCGGTADAELSASASKSSGKRVVHTKTNVWDFPYCRICVGHVMSAEATRRLAWTLGSLSLALGLILGFAVNGVFGLVCGILAMVGTGWLYRLRMTDAKARCSSDCVSVGRAVAYLGWHGPLHQFEVISLPYARDFMLANQHKLVNLSEQAKNLLAGTGAIPKTNARAPRRYRS